METVVLRLNGVYDLNFDASGASNKKVRSIEVYPVSIQR